MENNQIKYIVYCTTCLINKFIYVGYHKTKTPNIFDNYIGNGVYVNQPSTYDNPKQKFQYAVKKYGPSNFVRSTIAVFDTEEEALNLEAEIVNEEFLKRSDVYNVALGGSGGAWVVTAHKTYQYDETGKFIAEYLSIRDAAMKINRSFRSLWRAINDKCKCNGFFWTETKFEQLDLSKMHPYEGLHTIPVFQYDKLGNYECCYDSISDAGRVLNIHSANISRAIKLGEICKNKYFTSIYSPNYSISRDKQIKSFEIHQYNLKGEYIASYKNMLEAKNKLGIKANIYTAIKLGQTCGGFQWSFEELSEMAPVKPKSGKARKVGKFDKNDNLIEEYKSLAECKRINGASVAHVISGRNQFSKGFKYKYLDD